MKQLFFLIVFCFLFIPFTYAQDGAALYKAKGCVACHGPDGSKTLLPTYPKIAGQNAQYTVLQLKEFKSGKRTGSQSAIMKSFAVALSEAEMEAIAKYLESVKK